MKSMVPCSLYIGAHAFAIALAVSSAIALQAQVQPPEGTFRDRAEISHSGTTAHSSAFNGRPLHETVLALGEEYGWQVDYEDPQYDPGSEIVDADDPATRALHPDRPRIMFPNGGAFDVNYSEPTGSNRELSELHVLQSVVAAYNQTANPGRFFLENEPGGRIAVVGASKSLGVTPETQNDAFLSTRMSLPIAQRSLGATIQAILDTVTETTNIHASIGSGPTPRVMETTMVTVGGTDVTARDLLRQSLDQSGRTWLWSMLFEPTYGTYFLNVLPVVAAVVDAKGARHLVSVDPQPEPPRHAANHL
jgi:hypothetical protein